MIIDNSVATLVYKLAQNVLCLVQEINMNWIVFFCVVYFLWKQIFNEIKFNVPVLLLCKNCFSPPTT